jgi:imidazolonepropionase-like amidohydrolase
MKLALAWIGTALLAVGPSAVAPAAVRAADRIAVVGAKLFPSPDAPPIEDAVILIEGDRITRVGPRGSTPVPDSYRVIDETGHSITAGFWNSHVHLTTPVLLTATAASDTALQRELEKDFTRWGFTTIFDLASTTAIAAEVKSRIETGRVLGPRLLSVGEPFYPPAATPIYARPFYEAFKLPSAEIRSPAEAEARADRQIGAGDDGVKLFTGSIVGGAEDVVYMQADAVRAITGEARRRGKPSFAHPTDRKGLELAVTNGVGILAHTAPLMGPWSTDTATWIASKDVALVPTLALFADAANPDTPVATALQQTTALRDAGGVVLFGTDAGFTDAFDTATEMRLMRQALGWSGLLAALTAAPAKKFGEDGKRGRIAPGFIADLVILGGDPLLDVAAMSDVRKVIRSGRVIFNRP